MYNNSRITFMSEKSEPDNTLLFTVVQAIFLLIDASLESGVPHSYVTNSLAVRRRCMGGPNHDRRRYILNHAYLTSLIPPPASSHYAFYAFTLHFSIHFLLLCSQVVLRWSRGRGFESRPRCAAENGPRQSVHSHVALSPTSI